MEPLEKKVVVRKSHERKASQAAMIRPEKLAPSANNKEEDSVERTVRKIRKLISSYYKEEEEPLDFFQLILNPNDFGRTIRNLLYISFLVKDGIVKLLKGSFLFFIRYNCRPYSISKKQIIRFMVLYYE